MTNMVRRLLMVAPSTIWLAVFLVLPLCLMAYVSILQRDELGGVVWGAYTFDAYTQFLFERDLMNNVVLNADYLRIFGRSFLLAGATTVLTLLIGFPVALWMASQNERLRIVLVFVITVPFWTNILVRNYAWMLILRSNGALEWLLTGLHIPHPPIEVLYTPWATAIGLVYSFLPYMILPIYVSLEKIDRRLIEAAYDLGADRWRVLSRVILPLATPGLVGGAVLVFVPGLGAFISPAILGGSKSIMIGSLIQQQFGQSRNWPFGAALSFVLLALVLASLWAHFQVARRERIAK